MTSVLEAPTILPESGRSDEEIRRVLADRSLDPEDRYEIEQAILAAHFLERPDFWLQFILPSYFPGDFAAHHDDFLGWLWSIERGKRRRPFVGVWPRGGLKSTSAEGATVLVGATRRRKYGLYVCGTQDRANDHIATINSMLESPMVREHYPDMARRAVGEYGRSKGWKQTRLRTAAGFTIDAIGLDTAARGAKVDENRPDWVIVDDIDETTDGPATVRQKIERLSRGIIPAGSTDVVVMFIQNLIHRDGVMAQTIDGRAEMLADRLVSGPIPAIVGDYRIEETGDTTPIEEGGRPWRIAGGQATWSGQSVESCEAAIALVGPTAWESEAQHKPRLLVGSMYEDVLPRVAHCTFAEVPDLVRVAVCVDPAVTESDGSDSHGVQVDGVAANDVLYRLRSWEQRAAPGRALEHAIVWAYEYGALEVGVEENLGSDLSGRSIEESWRHAFAGALDRVLTDHPEWLDRPAVRIKRLRATTSLGSKAARSSVMHADYERPGRIVHVYGDHEILEAALGRAFVVKPYDLADAAFYSWRELRQPPATSGTGLATMSGSIYR